MKQDQETYVRARNASVIGLIIQLLLSIGVAILGLWTKSSAIQAVSWYLFGGLPVWIVLMLIYNQHRLERMETLENERIAGSDAAASAIFNAASDELDIARRRLASLYKWGLNGVSIFVSLFLLGVGTWLIFKNTAIFSEAVQGQKIAEITSRLLSAAGMSKEMTQDSWGWVIISFVIALFSFVAARYQAGMTKVKEWGLLRGGASYLMGVTVMMGLVCAGGVATFFEQRILMGILGLVIPSIMILLGLEMGLVHFLGAYRPRKQGDVPRPAFDSRLMGWLTSPESLGDVINKTINYQFGVEVSKSWFYRVMASAVIPLFFFMVGILFLGTSWVSVEKHQQALILNRGVLTHYEDENSVYPAGVHFKLPWPLGIAYKYDTGRVQTVTVKTAQTASLDDKPILWNVDHGGGAESYFLTGPAGDGSGNDSSKNSGVNFAMVGGKIEVQFKVNDLVKYAGIANGEYARKTLLRNLCERQVTSYFMTKDIDTLLGSGQAQAGSDLKSMIQKEFEAYDLGVKIQFVGLTAIHPPMDGEVAETYLNQNSSQYEAETEIEKAKQYATTRLSAVAGNQINGQKINSEILLWEKMTHEKALLPKDAEKAAVLMKKIDAQEIKIVALMTETPSLAFSKIYRARKDRWVFSINEYIKLERFLAEKSLFEAVPEYYTEVEKYRRVMKVFENARTKLIGDFGHTPIFRLDEKDIDSGIGVGLEIE